MSNLKAELFIRKQIQSILLREEKEEKEEEEKSRGPGKVFGGTGQGNYPAWVKEIFAGEDGSTAKAKRLASMNPGKLMSNLKAQRGNGKTTLERAVAVVDSVRSSNESFNKAIGEAQTRESSDGRTGYFYPNAGLPQDRQSTLFVFDTIRAAATVGYIKMTGHLRVEPTGGGTMVYQVRNNQDRWK